MVPLLPNSSRGSLVAELVHFGLGEDFRTSAARFSWEDLETTQGRLDRALLQLIEEGLVETSLDPRVNAVVIEQAAGAGKMERALVQRQANSEDVTVVVREAGVERFEPVPASCNSTARICGYPLRGGVRIDSSASSCSAGFKAVGTGGDRFLLTAGHCADTGPPWYSQDFDSGGEQRIIGPTQAFAFPGHDWAAINANGSYWDGKGIGAPWPSRVAFWGTNEELPITAESASYFGQYVCHSGVTTGSSCGYVKRLDATANYPEGLVYHLTEFGPICIEKGDSGGSVFAGGTALGLQSGGYLSGPLCSRDGLYAEITEATDALGVNVAPRPAAPGWRFMRGLSSGSSVSSWNTAIGMDIPQMAAGDVNGDGKADVVSVERDNGLYRYKFGLSNGSGIPSWSQVLSGMGNPTRLAVGDLTGDGKGDIVAVEPEGNGKYRYMLGTSNGAGVSSWSQVMGEMSYPHKFSVGDLTGDGKADIVAVESEGAGKYRYMLGISNGGGIGSWSKVMGEMSYAEFMDLGDFNADGKADVVSVENQGGGKFRYMFGISNGGGIGSWSQVMGEMSGPYFLSAGDFNADGRDDIVAVEADSAGTFRYMLGTSNGAGIGSWSQALGGKSLPKQSDLGDVNGDGKADVVSIETETTGSYNYRFGISNGSVVPNWTRVVTWMGVPQRSDVADVDGDGKADLVSVEPEGNGKYRYQVGFSGTSGLVSSWKTVLTGRDLPNAIAVRDLTGDGKADIVAVESEGAGKYRYMLGISNGAEISSWSSILTGMGLPTRMDLGDFSGDGKADIVAFEPDGSGKYRIMRGLSSGSGISSWSQVLGGLSYPQKAAVGDLTGDGKADVVAVESQGGGQYRYMLGKSSGSGISSWSSILSNMAYAEFMDLGDFNADGKADVVSVENQGNGQFRFMLGISNGGGIGSWGQLMGNMAGPYFFHLGDLNADGKADIVSAEMG